MLKITQNQQVIIVVAIKVLDFVCFSGWKNDSNMEHLTHRRLVTPYCITDLD